MHRVCVFAFRVACTVNLLAPVLIVRLPHNNEIIFKVLIVIVLSLLLELSFFFVVVFIIYSMAEISFIPSDYITTIRLQLSPNGCHHF